MTIPLLDRQCEGRKVEKTCAVRDYPPGIGPNHQRSTTRRLVSAIRDYPPFCGPNALSSKGDASKAKLMDGHLSVGMKESKRKFSCFSRGDGSKAVLSTKGFSNQSKMKASKMNQGNAAPEAIEGSLHHSKMKVLKHNEGNAASGAIPGSQNHFKMNVLEEKVGNTASRAIEKSLDHSKMKIMENKEGNVDHSKTSVLIKKEENAVSDAIDDYLNHFKTKVSKKKEGNAASESMVRHEALRKNGHDARYSRKFSDGKRSYGVNVPLLCDSSFNNHSIVTRNTVRATLRLFQALCRKLSQEVEAKSNHNAKENWKTYLKAAEILKYEGKYVNEGEKIFGSVPGVEVGDEFDYRVELNIVGLHHQIQAGIDYANVNGENLATSIVASGRYDGELDKSGVLIYSGHGGNLMSNNKKPEDQKLVRGNLALVNSIKRKNPVRVIRRASFGNGNCKRLVYDGLYVVEKYWEEVGKHGKKVFKFQLQRIPNQSELPWIELKNSEILTLKKGLRVLDISHGKEAIPIRAVNTIDIEEPPFFEYITRMVYPDWLHPTPAKGCDCTDRCSDPTKCSCAVKNGGIPFNHTGCIVEVKPLVYECGPNCKCLPDCYSRVSQYGIKFPFEIYKTDTRGWGVRALCSIPSGSFVCEYIGELLKDKEAEQRIGRDEYLFDIGNNLNNNGIISDGGSRPKVSEDGVGFTIDAARYGNLGRFFNHSCTPNMYAQNVLFDHGDHRIPHIMLFAAENIPPLKELTYDYNCSKGHIFNPDGSIKTKDCNCGSVGCSGRMY